MKTIIWLGLYVAILPFLGFPMSSLKTIFVVSGVLIAFIAFSKIRKEKKEKEAIDKKKEIVTGTFTQSEVK